MTLEQRIDYVIQRISKDGYIFTIMPAEDNDNSSKVKMVAHTRDGGFGLSMEVDTAEDDTSTLVTRMEALMKVVVDGAEQESRERTDTERTS